MLRIQFVPLMWFLGNGSGVFGQLNDRYVCVPSGYCNMDPIPPAEPGKPPGIDPRIVTPDQVCPGGLVPCMGQGPMSKCGLRFIPQDNMEDGTASNGSFPWQVYLQNTTHTFAGSGVLLDNYHILTAAHKVLLNVAAPMSVTVLVGVYDPGKMMGIQKAQVAKIIVHPNYTAPTLMNDLAILRLATPVALNQANVNTACLPQSPTMSYVGKTCVVSGWGQTSFTENDAPTRPMKQVYLNIVDYTTCRTSFSSTNLLGTSVDMYLDPMGEICAGGQSMRDACTQDGGSPLVCLDDSTKRSYVAGLVIWGKNCGLPGVYGVYVNVPFYKSWIETTIDTLSLLN